MELLDRTMTAWYRRFGRWIRPFVWFSLAGTAFGIWNGIQNWAAGDFSPTPFGGTWLLLPMAAGVARAYDYAPRWLRLLAPLTAGAGVAVGVYLLQTAPFPSRADRAFTAIDTILSAAVLIALLLVEWIAWRRPKP